MENKKEYSWAEKLRIIKRHTKWTRFSVTQEFRYLEDGDRVELRKLKISDSNITSFVQNHFHEFNKWRKAHDYINE